MFQSAVDSASRRELSLARNLMHLMHPFVQIQVVTSVMYRSYRINTIGSVIERVSVYWHKQLHLRQLFFFLDASFLITLLHHNLRVF